MHVRALVFDLDGLLVDTESSDHAAWARAWERRGQVLPRAAWVARIGSDGTSFDPLRELAALSGAELDEAALQAERRAHRAALLAKLPAMPGARTLLDAARERGLRTAVASSSPRRWVRERLVQAGLHDAFDVLCCAEDVVRVKPDPALYRLAVRRLGVGPTNAVAFEDSPAGVASAVAAGLFCAAVPGPMTRGLCFDAAHLQLASLADVALDALLETVAAARRATR